MGKVGFLIKQRQEASPILLTFSFPYARDLLNTQSLKSQPEARLVYNLTTGAPIKAD